MIRIGYACINTLLPSAGRTFRIANYSEQRMLETASSNLHALMDILRWNVKHGIALFRITSDLVPYGSHPINSGGWKMVLQWDLSAIGGFIIENGMRVSMHPGQYTVLNSPNRSYCRDALRDLDYHNSVLALMGLDAGHKIVIHGGGAYGNKPESTRRLIDRLQNLHAGIRERLALENDEKVYNAEEVLSVCKRTGLPAVFDAFHHDVLPSFADRQIREIVSMCGETWESERQKVHYSNQDPTKLKGAHSESIDGERFREFYRDIKGLELDVMLETKDKQESVLKLRGLIPELR